VITPATYNLETAWFIVHQPFIAFQVLACREARILLTEDPFDLSVYTREVLLGGWGNTKSAIYTKNNQTGVEKDTTGILDCEDFRQFWIRWESGVLSVGQGQLNGEELMSYEETESRSIVAVSISTGDGSTGEWQFNHDVGMVLFCLCYIF
jgi:hypothetical protein